MKKKIFGGVLLLAIAAVAAFNVNFNMNENNKLSSLALANIEALASGEQNTGCYKVEVSSTRKDNGSVVSESENVDCTQGGPSTSCTKSCKIRFKDGSGNWGSWRSC